MCRHSGLTVEKIKEEIDSLDDSKKRELCSLLEDDYREIIEKVTDELEKKKKIKNSITTLKRQKEQLLDDKNAFRKEIEDINRLRFNNDRVLKYVLLLVGLIIICGTIFLIATSFFKNSYGEQNKIDSKVINIEKVNVKEKGKKKIIEIQLNE